MPDNTPHFLAKLLRNPKIRSALSSAYEFEQDVQPETLLKVLLEEAAGHTEKTTPEGVTFTGGPEFQAAEEAAREKAKQKRDLADQWENEAQWGAFKDKLEFNRMSDAEMGGMDDDLGGEVMSEAPLEARGTYGENIAKALAGQDGDLFKVGVDPYPDTPAEPTSFGDKVENGAKAAAAKASNEAAPPAPDKGGTKSVVNPYNPTIPDKPVVDPYNPTIPDKPSEDVAEPSEEAAKPVADYEDLDSLFKVVHGGPFDPKSSMDAGKMEVIKKTLEDQGGLGEMTPNQFALKIYRDS